MAIMFSSLPCSYFDKTVYYRFTHFGETYNYLKNRVSEQVILLDMSFGGSLKNICEIIFQKHINIIVIYCETVSDFANTIDGMRLLKTFFPSLHFFLYGDICFYLSEYLKQFEIDAYHITGGPDIAIERYILFLRGTLNEEHLCNIIYKSNGTYKLSKLQGIYNAPDSWGFPALDTLPLERYFDHIASQGDFRKTNNRRSTIAVTVAKGCVHKCFFCPTWLREGTSDRRRPIPSLLSWLIRYGKSFELIQLMAPNFCFDVEWCHEFCTGCLDNHLEFHWKCCTRLDALQKADLSLLKKAGCVVVSFGVETLKEDSPFSKAQIKEIAHIAHSLKEYGIVGRAYVMLGLPEHNINDIEQMINKLLNLGLCVRPVCYTPFHELRNIDLKYINLDLLKHYDRKTYLSHWNQLPREDLIRLLCQEFIE